MNISREAQLPWEFHQEMSTLRDAVMKIKADNTRLQAQVKRLEAEREKLRLCINAYGHHGKWCHFDEGLGCSCGFNAARKIGEEQGR